MSDNIQSVDRALELLIYLQNEGKETSVTKIANDMGIYKSTAHRTLMTLESKGFVSRNPETEKYWLGNRLFSLGKSVENKLGKREIIRPVVKQLSEKYNEVVNVSVLKRNPGSPYQSLLVLKEMSDSQLLSVNPAVGSSIDCHCSAVGKCLLAFCTDVDLSVYRDTKLAAYTEKTITTYSKLVEELERVRVQGYAMDCDEQELGLTCIGTPVLDHKGKAIAAISLSGPTSRMLAGDIEEKINSLRQTAAEIATKF